MTNYEWTLLQVPGVLDVIERAAQKVGDHYGASTDDLHQEASMLVVNRDRNLAECIDSDQLGMLRYRLEQDLVDLVREEQRRDSKHSSFEERTEDWQESTPPPNQEWATANVVVPQRAMVSTYSKELVESLLPAVWDDSYCYGVRAENAPDPDMPRGSTNKATGNTAGAHFADIGRAWGKTPLTPNERQALFLRYCRDLTQSESAKVLHCSQQVVSNWLNKGIERLLDFLNGTEVADGGS